MHLATLGFWDFTRFKLVVSVCLRSEGVMNMTNVAKEGKNVISKLHPPILDNVEKLQLMFF